MSFLLIYEICNKCLAFLFVVSPYVQIHPKVQGVLPLSTIMINCFSTAAETYTWYKNGVVVDTSQDDRMNILLNGSLVIKEFTSSDNGYYFCRVDNHAGWRKSRTAEVAIVGKCAVGCFWLDGLNYLKCL